MVHGDALGLVQGHERSLEEQLQTQAEDSDTRTKMTCPPAAAQRHCTDALYYAATALQLCDGR